MEPAPAENWSPPAPSNDDGEIVPQGCDTCGGIGWIGSDQPVGHPDFGSVTPCGACSYGEDKEEVVRQYAHRAGLGPDQLGQSFQTWDNGRQPNPRHAAMLAEAFGRWASEASGGGDRRWYPWLVVMGGTGIGKTHLCVAAMWRLARRHQWATYISGTSLGDAVRDFDGDTAKNLKATMIEAHWLLLDDVGSAHDPNRYVAGIVQDVLNRRYDEGRKPTLLTSNHVGADLQPHIDRDATGRTWDRLNDAMVSEVIDASALVSVRGQQDAGGDE